MLNEISNRGAGMNLGRFGEKIEYSTGNFSFIFFSEGEPLRIFINDT